MDLLDYKPKRDTVTCELKNEAGEPLLNEDGTPMTWTLYLSHTKQFKEHSYEVTDLMLGYKEKNIPSKVMDDIIKRGFVVTTKEWNITLGKKKVKFTEDAAMDLLDWAGSWIIPQLQEARSKTEDFT